MTIHVCKPTTTPLGIVARLMGSLSAWLGMAVAPAYAVLLAVSRTGVYGSEFALDRSLSLPLMLPLIGLGLAFGGATLAHVAGQSRVRPFLAALLFNAAALGLALAAAR